MNIPIIAGIVSTFMFSVSTLPMLRKAFQTRDLRSYSLGHLALANGGNLIHSVYVYTLPPGPIWFLHTFHVLTTGLMLGWYLRYEGWNLWVSRRRSSFVDIGEASPDSAA